MIIDGLFALLQRQATSSRQKAPTFLVASCYMYGKFRGTDSLGHNYANVKRWNRSTNIFNRDLCFFPIHEGVHYSLCVLVTATSTLYYLDSQYGGASDAIATIRAYLACEARRLREAGAKGWVPPLGHKFTA